MRDGSFTLIANGSSASDQVSFAWPGGPAWFVAHATWGGGSVTLEYEATSGTWITVPSCALTANGIVSTTIPAGNVRVTVATATAAYAYLIANRAT